MAYDLVRTKSIVSAINCQPSIPTQGSPLQYIFVALNSSGQLVKPNPYGYSIGVLQNTPAIGDPGAVCYPGDLTKVLAGVGGLAAGQYVSTDQNGYGIGAVSGAAMLGQCVIAAAQGGLAVILYQPGVTP
jgi:hypothetical protein